MTFQEAAAKLQAIASEARAVAVRLEAQHGADGWVIGRDVIAIAASLDRYAAIAIKAADDAGEISAEDMSWIATAAPGELVEMYGK